MGKMTVKGLDAYLARMSALERATDKVVKAAVYEGARVVADAVRSGLESLPTSEHEGRPWWGTPGHLAKGPSEEQKKGLIDSFGVTPIDEDGKGFINVHIGFDGYNSVRSDQWPQGQPNQMVARAVESGTSFMEANPVVKKSVARSRKKAEKAMEQVINGEIDKVANGA